MAMHFQRRGAPLKVPLSNQVHGTWKLTYERRKLVKSQKLFQYTSAALVVILLFAVGPVQGQEPEPTPEPPVDGNPAEPGIVLAQPPYTMNYQGYLTDSGGTPLDGEYDLAFRLYDADTGGNVEWGTETHNNVQVTNGLFQVVLGSTVALNPDVFDEALFLAVGVEGEWLTTRQPLRTVPYAFGLVPGAEVDGDPTSTNYSLYVRNTGSGAGDRGLYARGNQYGMWAHGVDDAGLYASSSNGTYSIRSADAVYSAGGYGGPDTYVWVPVQNAVVDQAYHLLEVTLAFTNDGDLRILSDLDLSANTVGILIPIQVELPYGREYLLRNVRVYYKVVGEAYLTGAYIYGRDFSSGAGLDIGQNDTDVASTTFDTYDVEATDYYTITASQAPTSLELYMRFPTTTSVVYLYGVRLQLESDY
jgi:hypothetical protein